MENSRKRTANSSTENNSSRPSSSKSFGRSGKSSTMSHQEAGHLGGIAPHSCRGRECEQSTSSKSGQGNSSSRSSATSSNSGSLRSEANDQG